MEARAHKQKYRRALLSEINVVPYIDVMLVLLVIFMVTVPIIQQGVEVDLPKATAKNLPQDDEPPLVVTVRRDGRLFVNKGANNESPIARERLARTIQPLLEAEQGKVYVRGDRYAQYGIVVELMAQLQDLGATQIGLITEPPE